MLSANESLTATQLAIFATDPLLNRSEMIVSHFNLAVQRGHFRGFFTRGIHFHRHFGQVRLSNIIDKCYHGLSSPLSNSWHNAAVLLLQIRFRLHAERCYRHIVTQGERIEIIS